MPYLEQLPIGIGALFSAFGVLCILLGLVVGLACPIGLGGTLRACRRSGAAIVPTLTQPLVEDGAGGRGFKHAGIDTSTSC